MRIDIHTHILPRSWPDLVKRYGYEGFLRIEHSEDGCSACLMKGDQMFRRVEPNCWDPATRIEQCDEAGVDVQVLSTVPVMFSYWAKPEHTLDLSRFINDDLALTVQKYPKRFVALGTVPLQDADRAIVELERCTRELGFPGIEIGNHVGGVNLDDPRFDPIWEAAQDLGAAIFVHPWDMMARDRMERYWLPWLVGMPAESALAMASIAMGGVMDRYPDLRFCFAHGGGSFFATLGRIEHGFNMRPDLCQTHSQTLPTLTAKRFYVDALVHDHEALALLVNKAGVDKIALGTDYPFPLGELQPGRLVESADFLSSAQKKAIFSQTALQFLDLPQGTFG